MKFPNKKKKNVKLKNRRAKFCFERDRKNTNILLKKAHSET